MEAFSLMYHDVVPAMALASSGFDSPDANTYKVDAWTFERHLAAISSAVAEAAIERVTSPRQLAWRKPSDPPAVLLHFDDGGACALRVADTLERASWRGFFHITTDRIGTRGFVTISDVRALHRRGHVIGSHSCSHPLRMSSLPWDVLVREWTVSKAILEDLLGAPVVVASVPGGASSHQVIKAADHAGLEIVFTSEPTRRFDWIRGCLVLGRYVIRRTTRAGEAARLATGARLPGLAQWASWNTKKVLKAVGGEAWLSMRERVLGRYGPRAAPVDGRG